MTTEFKPGFELVPEQKPKFQCCFRFVATDRRVWRCTDGAVPDKLYCAVHHAEREAERKAAVEKHKRKWWQR